MSRILLLAYVVDCGSSCGNESHAGIMFQKRREQVDGVQCHESALSVSVICYGDGHKKIHGNHYSHFPRLTASTYNVFSYFHIYFQTDSQLRLGNCMNIKLSASSVLFYHVLFSDQQYFRRRKQMNLMKVHNYCSDKMTPESLWGQWEVIWWMKLCDTGFDHIENSWIFTASKWRRQEDTGVYV